MSLYTARLSRLDTKVSSDYGTGEKGETPVAYLDDVRDASGNSIAGVVSVDVEEDELAVGSEVVFEAELEKFTVISYGIDKQPDRQEWRLCDARLSEKGESWHNDF